jgi:hypothetical protein
LAAYPAVIPKIRLDEETIDCLDNLRIEDGSYDEISNIYEAEESTLFHGGDYSGD